MRHRNIGGFGIKESQLGEAWKNGKVGQIFKDETYYVPNDFGWLDKITEGSGGKIIGGSSIKSRISGIGLGITNIEGEPIWGNKKDVKWSDLRGTKGWNLTQDGGIQGNKRTINVRRVAYFDQGSGSSKKAIDLGGGVCMLKLPRTQGSVYLVVGTADLVMTADDVKKGKIKWNEKSKYVNEGWEVCYGMQDLFKGDVTLGLDWYTKSGADIKVDSMSTLILSNSEGKALSWYGNRSKKILVGVVLGVAVKGEKWGNAKHGDWKKENEKWAKNREWVQEVKGKFKLGIGSDVKSGIISFDPEKRWESVGDFKTTASAKYTWTSKQ